jgi:hypothetical protein
MSRPRLSEHPVYDDATTSSVITGVRRMRVCPECGCAIGEPVLRATSAGRARVIDVQCYDCGRSHFFVPR